MASRTSMMRILPLLREYGALERKRVHEGVTPLEYQRWDELEQTLSDRIFQDAGRPHADRRRHLRVPTRVVVAYRTHEDLRHAFISNVSKGGLFIETSHPPAVGTAFVLILKVDETGDSVEVPCEVVSTDPGTRPGRQPSGMGVKFAGLGAEQRRAIDRLFASALGQEALDRLVGG